jgi:hypothetical protein
MPITTFEQPASADTEALVSDLFALGEIGYVAMTVGQEVVLRIRPEVVTTTTEASNFFEELLVNPTLLTLAGQRGRLDCGGLHHIAVGYGDFTQLLVPMRDGHVSVGISRRADARGIAGRVHEVLVRRGRDHRAPALGLLPS